MNIREAKRQILNTVKAYLARDEYGMWEIPPEQQRPILMIGAPGIGKTAIMRQIAQELGINLVSYSMTHHTRQSALGLPHMVEKPWGTVTEYTVSEIINAVYESMRQTGNRQGILFLDEINCVSETLAPSMLQFLQFKTFGQHRVPDDWVIVTAGNPPEYNRSVRPFDVVMLDRLRVLKVEPDYGAWKAYASARRIHPAIASFLEGRKNAFYLAETTADGPQYVTARGWEDLSAMLRLYEKQGTPVDEALIGQYICSARISTDFFTYYELFLKYRSRFDAAAVLAGQADEALVLQAREARFDERYAVVGILLDSLAERMGRVMTEHDALTGLLALLKQIKPRLAEGRSLPGLLTAALEESRERLALLERSGALPERKQRSDRAMLERLRQLCADDAAWESVKAGYARMLDEHRAQAEETRLSAEHVFDFCEKAFADGQELLILVTEMTVNPAVSGFIAAFGCESYFAHSRDLVFYERKKEIEERLDRLDLQQL